MDADWMYSSYHYSHPILVERLRAVNWHASEKEPIAKGGSTASEKDDGSSELRSRKGKTQKEEL